MAEEITESKPEKIMYFLVVYLKDKTIHLWPGTTKEKCKDLESKLKVSKYKDKIDTFHYIKRDLSKYKDEKIL